MSEYSDVERMLDDLQFIDLIARTTETKLPVPPPIKASKAARRAVFLAPSGRILDVFSVLCICFFCVCGGPVGPEATIATNGPIVGILGMVFFPLLVSAPFAYVTTELCTAMPEDGGSVIWVLNAFGPFWAFQQGFWAWLAGVCARVVHIAVLSDRIVAAVAGGLSGGVVFGIKSALAIVLTVPVYLGIRNTVRLLLLLLTCVLLPFLVFTGWGFSLVHPQQDDAPTIKSSGQNSWLHFASVLFWYTNGFYMVSSVGGSVINPARTFPYAINLCFLVVFALYLLPLLGSFAAYREQWTGLSDVTFPGIARLLGGDVMHGAMVFSSICGTVGMYIAHVLCEAYQLSSMADCSLVPTSLANRNERFESPHNSILVSLITVVAVCAVDVSTLMQLSNAFYGLVHLMIMAAAMELRRSLPHMPRPTKVPGDIPGMAALLLLPLVMVIYILAHTLSKPMVAAVWGGLLGLGLLFYGVRKRCCCKVFGRNTW